MSFEVLITSLPIGAYSARLFIHRGGRNGNGGGNEGGGPQWLDWTDFGVVPPFVPRFDDSPCTVGFCHPCLMRRRIAEGFAINPSHYFVLGGMLITPLSSPVISHFAE